MHPVLPTMRALPETIAKTHVRAAFDHLARDVVVRVGIAVIALTSTLIYLVLALNAAGAAGPSGLLYPMFTVGITAPAGGGLPPPGGPQRLLQGDIRRLGAQPEECRDHTLGT